MPAPYQGVGLGATGFQSGFGQGGYNYGSAGSGYGPGNSFGNRMTSMIGGFGSAMGGAMPIAGAIGGGMMGGVGGAMMGFAGGAMVGGAVKHVAGSFMAGAHEQAGLERTLSQFQFQNAASRTGRGFGRGEAMQIGNMVRQMERMPEMLTSFGELNRVMDKMGQMGLMQGVRDAGEFMRKFKDTVSTIKDLAKVMGTTMEGALQAFGEARSSGFYSKGDIVKNVLNRQVTASVTGMSQDQVGALQQYGAQMGHGTGGSRRTGAQHVMRTANTLGMANQMGILSNDQIMEMTGKEGAAGIQDLAANMSQLGYRMGNSNVGQALTLALGAQKDGRYTGEMDQELVARVRSGEVSLSELKGLARRKAGTRGAKLSFAAHKNRLRSEMVGAVGAEGISMQLQEILGNRGWTNPDAVNLVMQRFGASEEQANMLQQLMPNLQSITSSVGLAGKNQARGAAINATQKEQGWDAIKARIGKKLAHYTTDWAKDLGVGVRDYFQNWADGFLDDVNGTYREYVTKRVSDAARFSIGGSAGNTSRLQGMQGRAQSFMGGLGSSRMDVGSIGGIRGVGSRLAHWASGNQTGGERAVEALGGLDKGLHLESGQISELEDQGAAVLDSSYWTRSAKGITKSGAQSAMRRFTQINSQQGGMQEWGRTLKAAGGTNFDADRSLREAYQRAMQRGDVQLETDPSKQADMVWKTMRSELPEEVLKKLEGSQLGRHNIMAGVQAAERASGNVYAGAINFESLGKGALGGLDLKNQAAVGRAMEAQDKSLGGKLKGSASMSSWAEVKSLVDSGSQMASVLTGNDKYRGLLGGGKDRKGKYSDTSGMTVRNIAAKDPSSWSDDERAILKEMGVDPTKLAAEINKDPAAWKKLQQAAASGKLTEDDVTKYMAMAEASGLNKITSDLNRQGSEIAERLKSDNYKQGREDLSKSTEGREVLSMLGDLGKSLEKTDISNVDKLKDTTGDIAGKIAGMKDKDMRKLALELGGEEVRAVYGYRQGTKKSLQGARGKGIEDVLRAGGLQLGSSDAESAFKKELEGMLGENKKLDSKEVEKVLSTLTNQHSAGIRTSKEGTGANSKYTSEQDIANSLKTLSDNNLKATQIIANLAGGKTGAAAMEGVSNGANK